MEHVISLVNLGFSATRERDSESDSNIFSTATSNCTKTTMIRPRALLQFHLRLSQTPARPLASPRIPTRNPSSHTRRTASTDTTATITNASASSSSSSSSKRSSWLRRLLYTSIFGSLGIYTGKQLDAIVSTPPVPGSDEDRMVLAGLQGIFDQATPIVQGLREDPDWEESDVYGNYSLEDKDHRLTSGPLRGSRGLGLQVGFFFFCFPSVPSRFCTFCAE